MPSSEFTEWIAYGNLEPFGADRDNIHAGIIAATIANMFRRKGKSASPKDFMLVDKTTQRKSGMNAFFGWVKKVAQPKKR